MKHIVLAMLIVVGLAWPVLAADTQAMVLATKGKATVTQGGTSATLMTGTVVKAGGTVKLEAGAQATLMVLPQGNRFEATGPAVLKVGADGLKAESGALKAAGGPQVALVPSGKNMGHMGGAALRAPAAQQFLTATMSNVSFTPLPGGKAGLRLTFDAPVNRTVEVRLNKGYQPRGWSTNNSVPVAVQDNVDADITSPAFAEAKTGAQAKAGGRYRYQVDVPFPEATAERLRVDVNFVGEPTEAGLITRTRLLPAATEAQLRKAEKQYRQWAKSMPNSPEPWVLLMTLYDENDKVSQAVEAGQQALNRAPNDLGILTAMARLQLESCHWEVAKKLFEQVLQQSAAMN